MKTDHHKYDSTYNRECIRTKHDDHELTLRKKITLIFMKYANANHGIKTGQKMSLGYVERIIFAQHVEAFDGDHIENTTNKSIY